MRARISDLARPDLVDLKPYVVKDVPHSIKMDANENPYDMPGHIRELITRAASRHPFNRYPDPVALTLRGSLAANLNVSVDQLVIGNGSDELINYIIAAFGGRGAQVIFSSPTFSIYGIFAQVGGTEVVDIPLSSDFQLKPDEIISATEAGDRSIVFVCYPNNPTGNCFPRQAVLDIIENSNAVVVLDEAYYEFSGETFLPMLDRYENLIILRTFSKAFGLAGMRTGYMIAGREVANEIMKVKMVYNINSFSQKVALILLENRDDVFPYVDEILNERERLFSRLDDMDNVNPFPTDANFILFRAEPDAEALFSALLENGILIRNLNKPGLLENCLRVTVGKPEENDSFLNVLTEWEG